MSEEQLVQELFLHDAAPHLLEAAVAANHRALFILRTRVAHGQVYEADGVAWTDPRGDRDPVILFPRLAPERAGEQLDTIVQLYRERQPKPLVGCWSLDPPSPPDLDVRLLARGFQPGWRPCWMWLDLEAPQLEHPQPDGLRIAVLEAAPTWEAPQLPYYTSADAAIDHAIATLHPRQLWHFVAWLGDEVVGQSVLFVTRGPLGIAGIYNVGVVPDARNRGVGKAVTAAACRQAQALGCRHALLNATGERMYRQSGFARIGYGWTWWLNVARLLEHPPTSETIALAEAVGRGDIDALAALPPHAAPKQLDAPLANGMTLLELAAHTHQPAAAEWLVARGARLDVVVAWALGWRERVAQLLVEHPARANRRRGEMAATPLHEAVQRDDHELARVLLAAGADVSLRDATFGATPLEWARHMRRTTLLDLLERFAAACSDT